MVKIEMTDLEFSEMKIKLKYLSEDVFPQAIRSLQDIAVKIRKARKPERTQGGDFKESEG